MGEVRIDVTLTNAIDVALAQTSRSKVRRKVRSVTTDAMVDTGAVRTTIPRDMAKKLGLAVIQKVATEYADGRRRIVDVAGPVSIEWNGRSTMEDVLLVGNEVLIGQTVLEKLDLLVDCPRRRVVPNPEHPRQPVMKVK